MGLRYFKKPIEVEAFRFGFETTPKWAFNDGVGILETEDDCHCLLRTPDEPILVEIGDFIIKEANGKIYTCKYDEFLENYDAVRTVLFEEKSKPFHSEVWRLHGNIVAVSDDE